MKSWKHKHLKERNRHLEGKKIKSRLEGWPNHNALLAKARETPERLAGQTGSFEHCNQMETPLGLGFCEAAAGDFSAALSRNREAWHSLSADLQEKRTKFGHPIFFPTLSLFL